MVHIVYIPKINVSKRKIPTGKAVFIIDTSYSTKSKLYNLSGKIFREILKNDTTINQFAVLSFDVMPRKLTKGFKDNTSQNRDKIFSILNQIWLEGATNFSSVLNLIQNDNALRDADTYFLLSDGEITWGNNNVILLQKAFKRLFKKRWICYSAGNIPVNQQLFNNLTRANGQIIHIGLNQDLNSASKAHQQTPVKLNKIYSKDSSEFIISGDIIQLYPGQILEIATRIPRWKNNFQMNVIINGVNQSLHIPLEMNTQLKYLSSRAWAELYTQKLLDIVNPEIETHILALSQRFSLTNQFASFIILETTREYISHNIIPEELNLRKLSQNISSKITDLNIDAPNMDDLPKSSISFIKTLKSVRNTPVWKTNKTIKILNNLSSIINKPSGDTGINSRQIYQWAVNTYKHSPEKVLRILSTIIELKPEDDQEARLVGYL